MPHTHARPLSPRVLLVCTEMAIAYRDATDLAHAMRELGDRVGGGLGERLRALSQLCIERYDEAVESWLAVEDEVRSALAALYRQANTPQS